MPFVTEDVELHNPDMNVAVAGISATWTMRVVQQGRDLKAPDTGSSANYRNSAVRLYLLPLM